MGDPNSKNLNPIRNYREILEAEEKQENTFQIKERIISNWIKYIVIGIIAVGIILAGFYFLFIRTGGAENSGFENTIIGRFLGFPEPKPKDDETALPSPPKEPIETTTPIEPKLVQLTDFPVSSISLNKKEDRVIFYKKDGGNMFSYDLSGKTKDKLSNLTIIGIFDVQWNTSQNRRVVSYLDQDTIKSFVHIATSAVALLPQQIRSPVWSPDEKSLAYLTDTNARLNLIIADIAGKNQKNVYTTPIRDPHIQWITSDRIIFETAPSGLVESFIFVFSRSRESFDTVMTGFGLTTKWSPDGAFALGSQTNGRGKKPILLVYDTAGNKRFDTNLATISEKCTWVGAKKAYCAVPRDIQSNAVWPDDYLRGEIHTADKLVIIDVEKNEVREVFNEGNFDISNLVVTKGETYALFIDRTEGTLWSAKLK